MRVGGGGALMEVRLAWEGGRGGNGRWRFTMGASWLGMRMLEGA